MKYYSTKYQLEHGNFPTPPDNKVLNMECFDDYRMAEEIGKQAWGWIEYENPLSLWFANNNGFVPFPAGIKRFHYIGRDRKGRNVYKDERGGVWKHLNSELSYVECIERGEVLYAAVGNMIEGEPDYPLEADRIEYCVDPADLCDI